MICNDEKVDRLPKYHLSAEQNAAALLMIKMVINGPKHSILSI